VGDVSGPSGVVEAAARELKQAREKRAMRKKIASKVSSIRKNK
jgi:hypothetical protein